MRSRNCRHDIDRIIDLVLRVQAGRLPPIVELARTYRCHRRTVSRTLAVIETKLPVKRHHHLEGR